MDAYFLVTMGYPELLVIKPSGFLGISKALCLRGLLLEYVPDKIHYVNLLLFPETGFLGTQ